MKRTGICLGWLLVLFVTLTAYAAAPDLMLLTKYRPGMDVSGWFMSEKLDGVRAYWDGRQLLSRQGKLVWLPPGWVYREASPF